MSDEIAIKIDHVSKDFRLPHEKVDSVKSLFVNPFRSREGLKTETQHALKNINFEVKKGEFFGIVGRNGSGKSTLLKIIANIYQPTKGKVTVNGRLVPFIELGVGFNPELSGRENTYLNGALMGFSTEEVDAKYDEIVKFAELERFMDQQLKNYSSGMQVRLAFSVATILADSDILLIDEVLAVGDADFQRKCFSYFKKLKKLKKTVVFVSHDMEAVQEYCDRCVLIDDSRLAYEGSSRKTAEKYTEMFNSSSEKVDSDTNSSRWGSGAARFKQPEISIDKKSITLKTEIDFIDTLDSPVIGAQIKNETGQTICGTNNRITQEKVLYSRAGDVVVCSWVFPNIFSSGSYTVDVAITYADGITQADWWNEAVSFSIKNDHSTSHIVSPKIIQRVESR